MVAPVSAPPRVRRGSVEDSQRMRQALLDAALALFEVGGVDAVTVRAVAARLGLSAMTPYRYFGSRADLLRELWLGVLAELEAHLHRAVAPHTDPQARHRALVEAGIDYWETHPAQFQLVFRTQSLVPVEPAPVLPQTYARLLDFGRQITAELALAIGADPQRAALASDLRVALQFGYLQAVMVNQRYPWSDLPALRRASIDAVLLAVQACLLGTADVAATPAPARRPASRAHARARHHPHRHPHRHPRHHPRRHPHGG